VRTVLRPSGLFAFNTIFYREAEVEGTRRFYVELMLEAMRYIRAKQPKVYRAAGTETLARSLLSRQDYEALLQSCGFAVEAVREEQLDAPPDAVKLLLGSPMFARGAFPGVPWPLGAEALTHAADMVTTRHGLTTFPRRMLLVIARRATEEVRFAW
jgi:hypothetical protein